MHNPRTPTHTGGPIREAMLLGFAAVTLLVCATGMAADRMTPGSHYRPQSGWVGDVHPIYTSGKWNLPYLEVPLEPMRNGLSRVHSKIALTTDMVNWTQKPIAPGQAGQNWWLIANLVYNGVWYSYYNGPQGMNLATSIDQSTWTNYAGNPVIPYSSVPADYELRDPSVFRNDLTNEWWLVIAGKRPNVPYEQSGFFYVSKSTDLFNWSAPTVLYDPGNIGVPECPELFKMGSKYFLIGSWGSGRVGQGRYRVSDNPAGPWVIPPIDTLDGPEIMAPNSAEGPGGRRVFFGWIPTYLDDQDYGQWEWAGHLAYPREMYTDGGTGLFLRPVPELAALRTTSTAMNQSTAYETVSGTWTPSPSTIQGQTVIPSLRAETRLPGTSDRFELLTTLTIAALTPRAGVLLRTGKPGHNGYEFVVDVAAQQIIFRAVGNPTPIASKPVSLAAGQPIGLRLFLDGDVFEAFVDDKWSLAARAQDSAAGDRTGFFVESAAAVQVATATFTHPVLHGVAQMYDDPPTPQTLPTASPARPGNSAAFPTASSNIYCPYDPILNFASSFSLECWVRMTPGTDGYKSHLIVKGDGETPGYHYGLELLPQNQINFFFRKTDGNFESATSPVNAIAPDAWTHIGGVLDRANNQMRIYVNGARVTLRTGVTVGPNTTNNGALRLGFAAGLPGGLPFYGLIDNIRVWGTARTDAQMAATYNRELGAGERTGMVVDWTMSPVRPETVSPYRLYCPNQVTAYPQMVARFFDGSVLFPESAVPETTITAQAAAFDNTSANVYCPPDPALDFTGGFTLETWMKLDPASDGIKGNLIVKGDGSSPGYHYGLNVMPNRSLELYYKNASGNFEGHTSAAGIIPVGLWVHVAGVMDPANSRIRLYKNGAPLTTKPVSLLPPDGANHGSLRLGYGAGLPSANRFYGRLDEVRLWRVARTDAQILDAYGKTLLPGASPDLVVNWPLDQWLPDTNTPQRLYALNRSSAFPTLRATLFDGSYNDSDAAPVTADVPVGISLFSTE